MASLYALLFFIFLGPFIILLALNLPEIFFKCMYTRYATWFAIIAADAFVIVSYKNQIDNPFISYAIGLYQSWFIIWAMVLIIIHKPHEEFCRLQPWYPERKSASGAIPSGADYYLIWQRFPKKLSFERIYWTLDLLINFRGICWGYQSESNRTPMPATIEVKGLSCTEKEKGAEPGCSTATLFQTGSRFAFDIAWLDMCQAMAFPWISHHLRGVELQTIEQSILNNFALRSVQLVITMTAVMSQVDLLNTAGLLWTVLFSKTCLFGTYSYHWAYPSPWGSLNAVLDDGIIGTL
jgi:hypothetical protein